MKYALGNMLNGAGGLNPDGLSLDLQFATDKTLTARKGPTPVLTRASTGTFIGNNGLIQSAAIDAARFDHDPVSPFACKGLLIEESRTNLIIQSEDFSSGWATTRASISVNQTVSPTGATTADKLITDTSVSNNHRVDKVSVSLSLNTVYTFSIYAKAGEYSGLALGVGAAVSQLVDYSLAGSGSVTRTSAGASGTIQQLSNGWYRCTCTFTSDLVLASHRACVFIGQSGTVFTYTGDGTSSISIWGAQLEAGAFVTSYIPTTTVGLARSADVCSITGANFTGMYNQTEGSMLVDAFTPASGARIVVSADNDSTTEVNKIFTNATLSAVEVVDNSAQQAALLPGSIVSNTAFKLASAYKLNDFAASRNGATVVTNAGGTLPTPNQLKIGYEKAGNTMCGCVASLRYYKKRLPDAKLQAITA
jgi:predicted secreted protein